MESSCHNLRKFANFFPAFWEWILACLNYNVFDFLFAYLIYLSDRPLALRLWSLIRIRWLKSNSISLVFDAKRRFLTWRRIWSESVPRGFTNFAGVIYMVLNITRGCIRLLWPSAVVFGWVWVTGKVGARYTPILGHQSWIDLDSRYCIIILSRVCKRSKAGRTNLVRRETRTTDIAYRHVEGCR